MWLDEKIGTRINQARYAEIEEAGTDLVGVSCPFCMVMLGNAQTEMAGKTQPFDVLELAARGAPGPSRGRGGLTGGREEAWWRSRRSRSGRAPSNPYVTGPTKKLDVTQPTAPVRRGAAGDDAPRGAARPRDGRDEGPPPRDRAPEAAGGDREAPHRAAGLGRAADDLEVDRRGSSSSSSPASATGGSRTPTGTSGRSGTSGSSSPRPSSGRSAGSSGT